MLLAKTREKKWFDKIIQKNYLLLNGTLAPGIHSWSQLSCKRRRWLRLNCRRATVFGTRAKHGRNVAMYIKKESEQI